MKSELPSEKNQQSEIRNLLALPLFMTGIFADDAHDVLALHDLARFTKSFY